jgi:hypothetical protein
MKETRFSLQTKINYFFDCKSPLFEERKVNTSSTVNNFNLFEHGWLEKRVFWFRTKNIFCDHFYLVELNIIYELGYNYVVGIVV